jgi:hypothetical protein
MFETPILLITFNRPRHAAEVLAQIKKQQPKRLYVFVDGPRPETHGDSEKCLAIKELIKKEVDWNCELRTLYEEKNLGCGYGPVKAITWFFDHVEEGIILEDDCFPAQSFFSFCSLMLNKYRYNEKISMITGTNFLLKWKDHKYSHIITLLGNHTGWASWKRAWESFDYQMLSWNTDKGKNNIRELLKKKYYSYYSGLFDKYVNYQLNDVWDYQWIFARWFSGGRTIVSTKNLISNIGFDMEGTHTLSHNSMMAKLPLFEMDIETLKSPTRVDKCYDWIIFERYVNPGKRTIVKKIILKLLKIYYNFN